MTFRQLVTEAAETIKKADIPFCDTPLLDASILLSFAAGFDREKLFAAYPEEVSEAVEADFRALVKKRVSGLPVSYIRNKKEFYGRDFYVDESVLVPRPDTEIIVEEALACIDAAPVKDAPLRVLDLCTGSGCIAVSLKLERPECRVYASDISKDALKTAVRNAESNGAAVEFIESNLFANISESFDIIVTNPPYLTEEEISGMKEKAWPEPMLALDGGSDGLDIIRTLVETSLDYLNNNAYLLIEAGPQQAVSISEMLLEAGFTDINIARDLAGRNRVTSGRKSGT